MFPTHLPPAPPESIEALARLLDDRLTVALTGAGISTESGIPDYRGPQGSLRIRRPVSYQQFVKSAEARRSYWARSALGWAHMRGRAPNEAHFALARMEEREVLSGVITQNVDGLHQAAGSGEVLELHGGLDRVRCLECHKYESRERLQERMLLRNPGWRRRFAEIAPDGDAELTREATASFEVPDCERCGGVLKPDVVFFGENVPRSRVEHAWRLIDRSDVLLVAGSSLAVYSGFRFAEGAVRRGKALVLINVGATRADALATVKVEARLGDILPRLASTVVDRLDAAVSGEIP